MSILIGGGGSYTQAPWLQEYPPLSLSILQFLDWGYATVYGTELLLNNVAQIQLHAMCSYTASFPLQFHVGM